MTSPPRKRKVKDAMLAVLMFGLLVLAFTLLQAIALRLAVPSLSGSRLPEVVDWDTVLPARPDPRWPSGIPGGKAFYMAYNEKLIIRDCTILEGSVNIINLLDSANLTMINVRFACAVSYIQVADSTYLKLVNVTNWRTTWQDHSSTGVLGRYSIGYEGYVLVVGDRYSPGTPRIWIENSRIAGVKKGDPLKAADITVVDSWFAESRLRTAVKMNATLSKTEYKWGEPISMTFSLENIGDSMLNFSEFDRFRILAYENGTGYNNPTFYDNWDDLRFSRPIPPEFRFPPTLRPGEVFTQTLTWQNPPLPPGKYYQISSSIYSNSSDNHMWLGFGKNYLVRVSEERWQG